MIDYHVHVVAHGEYVYSPDWICSFLETAKRRGIREIGFSEHGEYAHLIDLEAVAGARRKVGDIKIRLGLEADYIPGQEDKTSCMISTGIYDYIIGSVHFIKGWGFDNPDYRQQFDLYDIDDVYREYFNLVTGMVKSRLYDIVGHMDLVKIWGHRPHQKISTYTLPLLKTIRAAGMAVELNSAGLRKPVQEIYPAEEIIKAMYELNIPITFGSDAHRPDQVGEDFEILRQAAERAGYKSVVTFEQRRQIPQLI